MSSATATPDIGVAGIGETSRLDDGFQHLHAFNQAQANINGSKPDSRTDEGIDTNGAPHHATNGMDLGNSLLGSRRDGNGDAGLANADLNNNGHAHNGGDINNAAHTDGFGANGLHGADHAESDGTVENEAGAGGPPNNNLPPTNGADAGDAEEPKDPNHITVKVQDGENETSFKIKRTTKLGRVMAAYAERSGRSRAAMRFLFEGDRVQDDATPTSLELEDGDVLEVHMEQIGGGA